MLELSDKQTQFVLFHAIQDQEYHPDVGKRSSVDEQFKMVVYLLGRIILIFRILLCSFRVKLFVFECCICYHCIFIVN